MASPVYFHRLYTNSLRGLFLRSHVCTPKLAQKSPILALVKLARPQTTSTITASAFRPSTLSHSVESRPPTSSVLQFLSNKVWQATHRSRISPVAQSSRSRNPFRPPRPPRGPWQQFKDRIEAIPSNVIFWGILVLNGLVFAAWRFGWAQYVSYHPSSHSYA